MWYELTLTDDKVIICQFVKIEREHLFGVELQGGVIATPLKFVKSLIPL